MSEIKMLPLPEDLVGDLYDYEDRELRYRPTRAAIHSAIQDYARAVAEHNVKLVTAELHRQFGCELRDPNGTIWDHAAKLQAENEALRAEVGQEQDYAAGAARRVLMAQIAQRRAEARAERLAKEVEALKSDLGDYMDAANYQAGRADRLAEALRLIAAPKRQDGTWNRDREACRQIAAEALRDHDQEGKDG